MVPTKIYKKISTELVRSLGMAMAPKLLLFWDNINLYILNEEPNCVI
jgi:hypothetical protein